MNCSPTYKRKSKGVNSKMPNPFDDENYANAQIPAWLFDEIRNHSAKTGKELKLIVTEAVLIYLDSKNVFTKRETARKKEELLRYLQPRR